MAKTIKSIQAEAATARKRAEKLLREIAEFQRKMQEIKPDSPDLDVEAKKLQRLAAKRKQMFDMLSQVIDKYNETAKNVIQSIGR